MNALSALLWMIMAWQQAKAGVLICNLCGAGSEAAYAASAPAREQQIGPHHLTRVLKYERSNSTR